MNASIHSRDEEKDDSQGKTYRVYSNTISIRSYGGSLIVTATDGESYFPRKWSAVTPVREIERTLRLDLTPKDIKQILDAAIKANLIQASFSTVPKSKAKRGLRKVKHT